MTAARAIIIVCLCVSIMSAGAEGAGVEITFTGGAQYQGMQAIREKLPNVAINIVDSVNADELARLISTKDSSIDIYRLTADYAYSSMVKKGLAAELTGSAIITDKVNSMDESVRAVITNASGAVIAYPAELMIWTYGVNEGYWAMCFGDRPLPATFDELMDAWIEWERDFAADYPGVGFVDSNFDYARLTRGFIQQYAMQNSDETLPDMRSDALKSVLNKLREVKDIRAALGRSVSEDVPDEQIANNSETGPGKLYRATLSTTMRNIFESGVAYEQDYMYGVLKGKLTRIAPSFDRERAPQTDARMEVYVVNPYSQNIDWAIKVIECLASVEAYPQLYYAIQPAVNEPYPDPMYEGKLESYTAQAEIYEKAIKEALEAGENAFNLYARYDYYAEWLENAERNRWLINAETIEYYRSMIAERPYAIHARSPYIADEDTSVGEVLANACERYANGLMTIDAFLDEVAAKMEMVYKENQD